jgi:hypothetical protein
MDILVMDVSGVDEIMPHINELHTSLKNFPDMPAHYQGLEKIVKWVEILTSKAASDNLTDDEIRSLRLDLDTSCQQFKDVVCV